MSGPPRPIYHRNFGRNERKSSRRNAKHKSLDMFSCKSCRCKTNEIDFESAMKPKLGFKIGKEINIGHQINKKYSKKYRVIT